MVKIQKNIKKSRKRVFKPSEIISKKKSSTILKQQNSKDDISTVVHQIKNNELNEGVEFTAAEIIAKSDHLMGLIVKMLPKAKDRKNIKSSCRKFYHLCYAKKNNKLFLNLLDRKKAKKFDWSSKRYFHSKTFFEVAGNTLVVSIPRNSWITSKCLKKRREMVIVKNYEITAIEIDTIHPDYIKYFEELNCFNNVKCVSFDATNSLSAALEIFEACPGLRPNTIKFSDFHLARNLLNNRFSTEQLRKIFPKSVKCIYFDCDAHELEWFFDLSDHLPIGRFGTLVLTNLFFVSFTVLPHLIREFFYLSRCFNNIKVHLERKVCYDIVHYLIHYLAIINVYNGVNLSYDIRIILHKKEYSRFRPSIDEIIPENANLDLVNLVFLKLHHFRITCSSTWIKPCKTYVSPFPMLVEKMKNLTTIELTMRIFKSAEDLDLVIKNLNINIKNIKFCQCEKLSEPSIELLAIVCRKIVNLSFDGIKKSTISISKIISLFKNLEGLSIFYLQHHKNIDTLIDILYKKNGNNLTTIIWPELNFLQVVYSSPKSKDMLIVKNIEKTTARKPGCLLIKQHFRTSKHSSEVLEIIFQKSIRNYDEFMKLFTKPCWV